MKGSKCLLLKETYHFLRRCAVTKLEHATDFTRVLGGGRDKIEKIITTTKKICCPPNVNTLKV